MAFTDRLSDAMGLLTEGDPVFDFGVGLLANQGGNFGQNLVAAGGYANARDRARMENQAAREALLENKRKKEAFARLQELNSQTAEVQAPGTEVWGMEGQHLDGIPGKKGEISALATPEGQQELQGLLGQINPEAYTAGLIGQMFPGEERAEPKEVRIARVLNDPNTPDDVKESIRSQIAVNGTEAQIKNLELMQRQIELQQQMNELRLENRGQRQSRGQLITSVRTGLRDAKKLAELNQTLRGTSLETGIPMNELRRDLASGGVLIREALGKDAAQLQNVISAYDQFQKISSRFATDAAVRLFDEGALTNNKLQAMQSQAPSLTNHPDANDQIIADYIDSILDGATTSELDITNANEMREYANTLRGIQSQPQEKAAPEITVSRIQRMSREQLNALDPEQLNDAQLRAAIKRERQLEGK